MIASVFYRNRFLGKTFWFTVDTGLTNYIQEIEEQLAAILVSE